MAKAVSVQLAEEYAGQNSTFTMFCYKSADLHDALLEQWFLDKLSKIANANAKKNSCKIAA
jgi:hypothetical protein